MVVTLLSSASKTQIGQLGATLKPLTGKMNNILHLAKMKCSPGKSWVQTII